MHEKTFRRACDQAGLNKFMCEMANIREHCSWIHEDRGEATAKAIDIGRTIIEKVKHNRPLETIKIPITKRAMVIGGGIAGIQAALDIADGGHEVILVEKEASIGGHMSQLSETFPTLDCSQCILTPRMVEAYQHPNIKLHTWSEVEKVDGYIGNFEVTVRKKARSVDQDLCNGCGDCFGVCPAKKIPSEFEAGLGNRTAIYVPFPQAVPNQPVLDRENCTLFKGRRKGLKKEACGKCKEACLKGAIDYDTEDELRHRGRSGRSWWRPATSSTTSAATSPRASRATASTATARCRTSSTACSSSAWPRPAGRRRAPSSGRPTARSPRRWSSSTAWAPATRRRAWRTAARSAACTTPSTPCSTSTRCTTAARWPSTWTSAPTARATTSSAAAPSKRTAPSTSAGV